MRDGEEREREQSSYATTLIIFLVCSLILHMCIFLSFLLIYKTPARRFVAKPLVAKNVTWTLFATAPIKKNPLSLAPCAVQVKPEMKKFVSQPAQETVPAPARPIEQERCKAKLKARRSTFGWADPQEEVATRDQALSSLDADKTEAAIEPQEAKDDAPKDAKLAHDTTKIIPFEQVHPSTVPLPSRKAAVSGPPTPSLDGTCALQSNEIDELGIAARIAAIDRKQALIDGYRGGEKSTRAVNKSHVSLASDNPARGKAGKRPNIIALTKGFLDTFNESDDGNSLIDRDGDENLTPSFEEEKYISYEAKINWCLQSSWKLHFERRQLGRIPPHAAPAYVEFILDSQGNLTSFTLLQSSGSREIDAAIMKNMKLAAPFPPLPKHFNVQSYHTGRRINIVTQLFGA